MPMCIYYSADRSVFVGREEEETDKVTPKYRDGYLDLPVGGNGGLFA